MKTVTTREVQHHFAKVLEAVEAGEEVEVTRRGKAVARVVPSRDAEKPEMVDWVDSIRMRNEALADLPQLKRNIVLEMREEERY